MSFFPLLFHLLCNMIPNMADYIFDNREIITALGTLLSVHVFYLFILFNKYIYLINDKIWRIPANYGNARKWRRIRSCIRTWLVPVKSGFRCFKAVDFREG